MDVAYHEITPWLPIAMLLKMNKISVLLSLNIKGLNVSWFYSVKLGLGGIAKLMQQCSEAGAAV